MSISVAFKNWKRRRGGGGEKQLNKNDLFGSSCFFFLIRFLDWTQTHNRDTVEKEHAERPADCTEWYVDEKRRSCSSSLCYQFVHKSRGSEEEEEKKKKLSHGNDANEKERKKERKKEKCVCIPPQMLCTFFFLSFFLSRSDFLRLLLSVAIKYWMYTTPREEAMLFPPSSGGGGGQRFTVIFRWTWLAHLEPIYILPPSLPYPLLYLTKFESSKPPSRAHTHTWIRLERWKSRAIIS